MRPENVGGGLDHLVEVGVVERVERARLELEIPLTRRAAPPDLGRAIEVFEAPRLLALRKRERQRDASIDVLPLFPKPARQVTAVNGTGRIG